MNDTHARLWHPWLRINRVQRVMLTTRWSAEAWPRGRLLVAALGLGSTFLLAGCGQFYWTRPGSGYAEFAADHRDCLQTGGFAVKDQPGYVVVPEANFRSCLVAKGWMRQQWIGHSTTEKKPANLFRGLEDFPSRPVSIDSIPEQ